MLQETNKIEWFFYKLQAHVNYYPIAKDAKNLVEAVEYLKANDKKAREISEAGTELARKMFGWDEILKELRVVLEDIANAQQYTIPAAIQIIVKNSPRKVSFEELIILSQP